MLQHDMAISTISLFSGVGMLDEGLRAGFDHLGIAHRTVCHVERESYAAAVLAARMEEGSLDEAPIWSDVCTFDAAAWRGKVDCIVAGFPCQDLSIAGKRAGLDGKRSGLFFEVVRIANDSGAWCIFLENVAGIASATATVMDEAEGELDERAAARVLGELADHGWDAEWLTLSASAVGASHGRARWFCLAWRVGDTEHAGWHAAENSEGAAYGNDGTSDRSDAVGQLARSGDTQLAYAEIQRDATRDLSSREQTEVTIVAADSASMAHANGARSQGNEFGIACAGNRKGTQAYGSIAELCSLFGPGPSDQRWASIIANYPEAAPALEPTFRSMVNGLAFDMDDSRAAQLKCIGNGVVALCAAAAFVVLFRRAVK